MAKTPMPGLSQSRTRRSKTNAAPIKVIKIDDNGPASAYSNVCHDMPSTSTSSGHSGSSTSTNSLQPETMDIIRKLSFVKDNPEMLEILESGAPYTTHAKLQKEGRIAPLSNSKRPASKGSENYAVNPFAPTHDFGSKRACSEDDDAPSAKRRNVMAEPAVLKTNTNTTGEFTDAGRTTRSSAAKPAKTPQSLLDQIRRRPRSLSQQELQSLFKLLKAKMQMHVERHYNYDLSEVQKNAWPLYHLMEKYPSLHQTTLYLVEQKSADWLGFFTEKKSRCAMVHAIIGDWLKHRVFEHPCFGINDNELDAVRDIDPTTAKFTSRLKLASVVQKIINTKTDQEHKRDLFLNASKLAEDLILVIAPLLDPVYCMPNNYLGMGSMKVGLTILIADAGAIAQAMRLSNPRRNSTVVNTIVHSIPIGNSSESSEALTLEEAIDQSRIAHNLKPHSESDWLTTMIPFMEWLVLGGLAYGAYRVVDADLFALAHQVWESCPQTVKTYLMSMNLDDKIHELAHTFNLMMHNVTDLPNQALEYISTATTSIHFQRALKRMLLTAAHAPGAMKSEYLNIVNSMSSTLAPHQSRVSSFVSAQVSDILSSSIPAASSALSTGYVDASSHVHDMLTRASGVSDTVTSVVRNIPIPSHISAATGQASLHLKRAVSIIAPPAKTMTPYATKSRWFPESTVFENAKPTPTLKTVWEKMAEGLTAVVRNDTTVETTWRGFNVRRRRGE